MNTYRVPILLTLLAALAPSLVPEGGLTVSAGSAPVSAGPAPQEIFRPERTQVLLLRAEKLVFDRVNEVRLEHGLNPLVHEIELTEIARDHSMDMMEREFFAHQNPEGQGPAERVSERHRRLIGTTAENIWMGIRGDLAETDRVARDIMESLMGSPGHRVNILSADSTHLGVGVSQAAGREVLSVEIMATQLFASIHAYTKDPVPTEFGWGAVTNFEVVSAGDGASRKSEFVDLWSPEMQETVSETLPIRMGRLFVPTGTYQLRFFFRDGGSSTFAIYPGPMVKIN